MELIAFSEGTPMHTTSILDEDMAALHSIMLLIHLWNATISFEAKEEEWLVNRVQLTTTVPLDKYIQLSLNHFSVSGYLHPRTLFRSMDTPIVDGVALVLSFYTPILTFIYPHDYIHKAHNQRHGQHHSSPHSKTQRGEEAL
ncbi:hypothetical protein IAQ61_003240 [Plenodomus lingam]|uniref:uncharacterized protein n=1 Tax=Leptosphaeria maculans TaxID=5022 RepID=UPI00332D9D82|nr:hypothetical protein IAQ61_003240 [Plenodomus lingam]